MMRYVLASFLLFAGTTVDARPSADDFKYSEWEAWNSFREGVSVTSEIQASGVTMTVTTKCAKKEAAKITLEITKELSGNKLPAEMRVIEKPKAVEDAKCPKCGRPGKDHAKILQGQEKIKVGDKNVDCVLIIATTLDCDGKETGSSKSWYSKEVPGWIVKLDTKYAGSETHLTVTGFDSKK